MGVRSLAPCRGIAAVDRGVVVYEQEARSMDRSAAA